MTEVDLEERIEEIEWAEDPNSPENFVHCFVQLALHMWHQSTNENYSS